MLDIRLEIGQINYRKCIEAMLPPMVEHCAAKEHPGELDSFLADLGTDAVPAAFALLDRMSTDEKDEMVIWLIMSHEERLRNAANRHLAALLGLRLRERRAALVERHAHRQAHLSDHHDSEGH